MIHEDEERFIRDFIEPVMAFPQKPAPFYWNGRWHKETGEPMTDNEAREFLNVEPNEDLWVTR